MKPRLRMAIALAGALALLLALIGVWLKYSTGGNAGPRVAVAGGDAGGLPRAQPSDEHIDGAALERAAQDRAADGLRVLIVMRDGHVVFDRYAGGLAADTVIDGGPMSALLSAMAAGIATKEGLMGAAALHGFDPGALRAAIETGAKQRYESFLSSRLWSRVNAAPAWIALPGAGAPTPADCCFHARVLDWLRLAGVLVDDGRFEGKQILPPGWVQRMQRPLSLDSVHGFGVELAAAAHGTEPFAVPQVFFVRGTGRWRLWLVPPLKLAVLFGAAGADGGDETRLPNLVIRAVSDRPTQPGDMTDLQRLVPNH